MDPVRRVLRGLPIQAKLTVGPQDDVYEREADRVADRVMRMPDPSYGAGTLLLNGRHEVQRRCAECENEATQGEIVAEQVQRQPLDEEEEQIQAKHLPAGAEQVQRQAAEEEEEVQAKGLDDQVRRQAEEEEEDLQAKRQDGTETTVSSGQTRQVSDLRGRGQPLPARLRAFYEPRFGTDFSDVSLHTDARAGDLARALRARAFTRGTDIVFGPGEYAPDSWQGRHLLAHELTHVVQQKQGGDGARISRWSYGSGSPADPTYVVVPEDEKKRVEAGMKLIKRVAENPKRYPRCHKRFADLCSAPAANELLARYNAAVVWKETSMDPRFKYGSSVSPDHIAYSALTWRWGRWMIASTLLHEMMHRCGFNDEGELLKTERICGFPGLP